MKWAFYGNIRSIFRLKMHEERNTKTKSKDNVSEGAVPAYLLDREEQSRAKVLSNMIKQKRKEKAVCDHNERTVQKLIIRSTVITLVLVFQGKWDVPIPKVKAQSEADVFKVVKTGKTRSTCQTVFVL